MIIKIYKKNSLDEIRDIFSLSREITAIATEKLDFSYTFTSWDEIVECFPIEEKIPAKLRNLRDKLKEGKQVYYAEHGNKEYLEYIDSKEESYLEAVENALSILVDINIEV